MASEISPSGKITSYMDSYSDNPNIIAELIGEPITLKDGSEFGLISVRFSPSGNHEILAVRVGESFETFHGMWEEDIVELGDGNFHVGVMKHAKDSLPSHLV